MPSRPLLRSVRPSPTRNSALTKRDLARKRGNPALASVLRRRKKAANALSSLRKTCCSAEKLNPVSRSSASRVAFNSLACCP
jgi:ferric iron reductase protein FhuF